MKMTIKKSIAIVSAVAVAMAMFFGASASFKVSADATPTAVSLGNWDFLAKQHWHPKADEDANGNQGQVSTVVTSNNETLTFDQTGTGQTLSSSTACNGWSMNIVTNGWDCLWPDMNNGIQAFNPHVITATMPSIPISAGHIYTVKFKAKASSVKYAYAVINTIYEGEPKQITGDQLMKLTTTDQEFSYTFTNYCESPTFDFMLMLGAFFGKYDYAGNDRSDVITDLESNWKGTVVVSDFSITDYGVASDFVPTPSIYVDPDDTTKAPEASTAAPEVTTKADDNPATTAPVVTKAETQKFAKVTGVKAKNNKKGRVTVTWKKVTSAKKYQIKFGTKTYTSKKTKLVVKKGLKKGKSYSIKVRAMKSGSILAGPWSKAVKVKIKK